MCNPVFVMVGIAVVGMMMDAQSKKEQAQATEDGANAQAGLAENNAQDNFRASEDATADAGTNADNIRETGNAKVALLEASAVGRGAGSGRTFDDIIATEKYSNAKDARQTERNGLSRAAALAKSGRDQLFVADVLRTTGINVSQGIQKQGDAQALGNAADIGGQLMKSKNDGSMFGSDAATADTGGSFTDSGGTGTGSVPNTGPGAF